MKTRNYGIDFLRMLSMFMIVVLHTLGRGGILAKTAVFSNHYWVAWFLEISAYCAVDCFALISGYVMHNSRQRPSKLLELWIQIFFYSTIITSIIFIASPNTLSIKNIINAVFPITTKQYWYLSAYFAMYLFLPVLNHAINELDHMLLRNSLIAVFIVMILLPTGLQSNPYSLAKGYSAPWLCILYLTGGYIEKYGICNKIKQESARKMLICSILITFLSKMLIEYLTKHIFGAPKYGNLLVSFTSPTIILAGLSLFILCCNINPGPKARKVIALFSPAALGVYIIHCQPLVWNKVILGFSKPFLHSNCPIMMIQILASAFLIWLACSLIDICRIKLFRLLKIKEFCTYIENQFVKKPVSRLEKKVETL